MRLRLRNSVHGERARPREPPLVSGSLVEFQERVALAGGTVAEIGSFLERAGLPRGFSAGEQKVIQPVGRQVREADDEAGGPVTELHQTLLRTLTSRRRVEVGGPVRLIPLTLRRAPDRIVDALLPRVPLIRFEQLTTFDDRQGGSDKAVHSIQAREAISVKVLRPVAALVLR